MSEASEKIHAQLLELRARYALELPKKISELRADLSSIQSGKALSSSSEAWRHLHRKVHSITGSAGTFGYPELSDKARVFEQALRPLPDADGPSGESIFNTLENLLRDVEHAAALAPSLNVMQAPTSLRTLPADEAQRLIFVVDDDTELAREQRLQYELHGYQVREFNGFHGLLAGIRAAKPRAIVMDIVFPEGTTAGTQKIAELRAAVPDLPPVIFVSQREDLQARLESVRAGAAAYFLKPLDLTEVIATLDRLTAVEQHPPYRILIVDDDETLAKHNALLLEGAGMCVQILTAPGDILGVLPSFHPDLILMDLYLPQCTGIELAAVIRQHEAFVSMPIVFFSVETDVAKHLDAMRAGGDDFLLKPLSAAHLIATIEARARRARAITSLMVRDSLTGLLNHAHIEEQLLRELSLRARHGGTLSYALIDLDHFKKVNDTHGHASGDRVLRGLSRLLRQRFRQTDLIGRYGGEEFVVVLPNTPPQMAIRLIDTVREAFSRINFHSENQVFNVTFSAGIAGAPPYIDAPMLQAEADKALYQAKAAGRNQTVLAAPYVLSAGSSA